MTLHSNHPRRMSRKAFVASAACVLLLIAVALQCLAGVEAAPRFASGSHRQRPHSAVASTGTASSSSAASTTTDTTSTENVVTIDVGALLAGFTNASSESTASNTNSFNRAANLMRASKSKAKAKAASKSMKKSHTRAAAVPAAAAVTPSHRAAAVELPHTHSLATLPVCSASSITLTLPGIGCFVFSPKYNAYVYAYTYASGYIDNGTTFVVDATVPTTATVTIAVSGATFGDLTAASESTTTAAVHQSLKATVVLGQCIRIKVTVGSNDASCTSVTYNITCSDDISPAITYSSSSTGSAGDVAASSTGLLPSSTGASSTASASSTAADDTDPTDPSDSSTATDSDPAASSTATDSDPAASTAGSDPSASTASTDGDSASSTAADGASSTAAGDASTSTAGGAASSTAAGAASSTASAGRSSSSTGASSTGRSSTGGSSSSTSSTGTLSASSTAGGSSSSSASSSSTGSSSSSSTSSTGSSSIEEVCYTYPTSCSSTYAPLATAQSTTLALASTLIQSVQNKAGSTVIAANFAAFETGLVNVSIAYLEYQSVCGADVETYSDALATLEEAIEAVQSAVSTVIPALSTTNLASAVSTLTTAITNEVIAAVGAVRASDNYTCAEATEAYAETASEFNFASLRSALAAAIVANTSSSAILAAETPYAAALLATGVANLARVQACQCVDSSSTGIGGEGLITGAASHSSVNLVQTILVALAATVTIKAINKQAWI